MAGEQREKTFKARFRQAKENDMSKYRLQILFFMVVGLLFVAQTGQSAEEATQRQKEEATLQETLLRALFTTYGKPDAYGNAVPHEIFYLELAGRDPSPAFLKRFQRHKPPVFPFSRAGKERRFDRGIRDPLTGKRGTLFSVDKITWLDATHVHVSWGWHYGPWAAMSATYRVVKQKGRWKVGDIVGPVIKS
jgi:hypothetical protein